MTENQVLMWIGNVALLLDMYLVGRKSRLAWIFCIIGEALWIVMAIHTHLWALAFICAAFLFLGVKNWFLWRKSPPK